MIKVLWRVQTHRDKPKTRNQSLAIQQLPIRYAIAVDSEPRPCGTIELAVTKSTMTHHFRVLREAGVIRQERHGTTKLTSLRRDDLDARFPGLLEAVLSSAPAAV